MGHIPGYPKLQIRRGSLSCLQMPNAPSCQVAYSVSKSQMFLFNLTIVHWESGSSAWQLAARSPRRAGLSKSHTCTPFLHTDPATHTAMHSVTPSVTEAHAHRHAHSQSHKVPHWGLAVGAGSGRQLRKSPHSSPLSLPLTAPPLLPLAVPAPGAAWPGTGNSSASRRLQAPRNPIPTQPQAEPGRGAP